MRIMYLRQDPFTLRAGLTVWHVEPVELPDCIASVHHCDNPAEVVLPDLPKDVTPEQAIQLGVTPIQILGCIRPACVQHRLHPSGGARNSYRRAPGSGSGTATETSCTARGGETGSVDATSRGHPALPEPVGCGSGHGQEERQRGIILCRPWQPEQPDNKICSLPVTHR